MKVLVCMDSSIYADEILNEIARRAWLQGTGFVLMTAVEPSGMWDCDSQTLHQAEKILFERVRTLQEKLKGAIKVEGEVLEGAAAKMIVAAAIERAADLIMIGSHGDTGVRKSGIGSVAAAVVNEAPCSVEVIKLKTGRAERKGMEAVTSKQK